MGKRVETTWTCDLARCEESIVQHEEYGGLPRDWVEVEVPASIDNTPPMYDHVTKHFCGAEHAGTHLMQRHADKVVRDAEELERQRKRAQAAESRQRQSAARVHPGPGENVMGTEHDD